MGEREERLARKALTSYAQSFTAKETPEDYSLVMRKDVWDKELEEETAGAGFDTLEDIEIRDKREKIEQKTKTKQEKMREERLKRMQAFQASSAVRMEEEVEEEEMEEDEAALAAINEEGDSSKRRKMAEFNLWKSQRRQSDPNKVSKDVVDAQQELDKAAFDERWKNDEKMKEVFTSSKLVSKAKMKMKLAAGASASTQPDQTKVAEEKKEAESSKTEETSGEPSKTKEEDTVTDLPGMIGSVT